MNLEIPLKIELDIPESHYELFTACNSAAKHWAFKKHFYYFKTEFLSKHGRQNHYDLQIIKKECFTCDGTGIYKSRFKCREMCWSCSGTGIYQTKNVVLKRWLLNGKIFHEPLGELYDHCKIKVFIKGNHFAGGFDYVFFDGIFKSVIQGYIKHDEPKYNPTYSFFKLLLHYDLNLLYKILNEETKKLARIKIQLLNVKIKQYGVMKFIKDFYKIKNKEVEAIEDLPF